MSVLTLSNVTYKYDKTKNNVLKGVSASFEAGKVYAAAAANAIKNHSLR